jgi:hypothetical protein
MIGVGGCDHFDVLGFFTGGASQVFVGVVGKDRGQGQGSIRVYRGDMLACKSRPFVSWEAHYGCCIKGTMGRRG